MKKLTTLLIITAVHFCALNGMDENHYKQQAKKMIDKYGSVKQYMQTTLTRKRNKAFENCLIECGKTKKMAKKTVRIYSKRFGSFYLNTSDQNCMNRFKRRKNKKNMLFYPTEAKKIVDGELHKHNIESYVVPYFDFTTKIVGTVKPCFAKNCTCYECLSNNKQIWLEYSIKIPYITFFNSECALRENIQSVIQSFLEMDEARLGRLMKIEYNNKKTISPKKLNNLITKQKDIKYLMPVLDGFIKPRDNIYNDSITYTVVKSAMQAFDLTACKLLGSMTCLSLVSSICLKTSLPLLIPLIGTAASIVEFLTLIKYASFDHKHPRQAKKIRTLMKLLEAEKEIKKST